MNPKIKKTIEYKLVTSDDTVWCGGFPRKEGAIRYRNRTWPQIEVHKVTTLTEVVARGKLS